MTEYAWLRDFWDGDAPAAPNPNLTYIEYLLRDRIVNVRRSGGARELHLTERVRR
jgi:hypothetical protein